MMIKILIVTQHADNFSSLATGLSAEKTNEVIWANSIKAARSVALTQVDLVIIDESLDGRSGIDIAKDMISVNAMAQLALVSTLSPEEFHEASEGLGVLASLPPHPEEKNAEQLLNALVPLL
ncbi:MAG: hypothetical protein WA151_16775 [Desulfatirhabdiaceae bacterium]